MPKSKKLLLPLLLLAIALSGCGGSALNSNKVSPDGLVSGTVSREQLLGDLATLQPAGGVSAEDLASVKGALKAALIDSSETKFTVHPPRGPNSTVTDLTLAILPDGSSGIQWTYVNPGDYNFDGQVNLHDLVNLAAFLGATSSSDNWDKAQYVDGDGNGAVTIADITPIAVNFLGTVTAWQIEGSNNEDGPYEQVSQVPTSEGEAPSELHPSEFNVPLGSSSASFSLFRICTLDSEGTSGESSNVIKPAILKPNVHYVSSTGPDLMLAEKNGFTLILRNLGAVTVKPGDILFSDEYGREGLILRVDEIVAAEHDLTVHCSPANLADVIQRGAIQGSLFGPPESPWIEVAGSFQTGQLASQPGLQIDVTGGEFNLKHLNGDLAANYGANGLSYGRAGFHADSLDFAVDLHVSGTHHLGVFPAGENANRANYERVVDAQGFVSVIPLVPDWEIPVRVTCTTYLGVEGGGLINGEHDLHLSGSFGEFNRGAAYNAATGNWELITFLQDPVLNETDAPQLAGNSEFGIEPYLRTEIKVELFFIPPPDPAPGDVQLNLLAKLQQHNDRTMTPVPGYNFTQQALLRTELSARLEEAGISLEFPTDSSENASPISSGFVADRPPTITRTISGYAYDGTIPLQDVEITVRNRTTFQVLGTATTDGEGNYAISGLPDGAVVTLTAALEGYLFYGIDLALDSDQSANFYGTPAQPPIYGVSGYITDYEQFTPILGALVSLYTYDGLGLIAQAETDSAGHYSFPGVVAFSTVRVVPSASGYSFIPSYAMFTVTGEMGQDFTGYAGSGP